MCHLRLFALLLILLFSVILFYQRKTISESFITGTDVQLLTSKPYYTMYDYLSNRKYQRPYILRYPYINPFYNIYKNTYPYVPFYRPYYF